MSTQKCANENTERKPRAAVRPERIDPSQAYDVHETCAALRISRAQYYVLVSRGVIKPITSLGAQRISGAEIIRITTGQSA